MICPYSQSTNNSMESNKLTQRKMAHKITVHHRFLLH